MNTGKAIPLDDGSRHDPQLWPRLCDTDWVALHVSRFAALRPWFERCEGALRTVLSEACGKLAPKAIVQVRTKRIPSFAEKILRKKPLYSDARESLPPDPLMRLTDLCGGRVICLTQPQMEAVSDYLKGCFEVDWANSDDAVERLQTAEFGYRSVNLVVSFRPGVFPEDVVPPILCEPIPVPGITETMPLKMEIQVRTLLAHAWADLSHDLFYKTDIRVPAAIQRNLATVAAILEETDRGFARLIESLEEFHSNYGAHQKRDQVIREIQLQRIVLDQVEEIPRRAALAVRIAKLALAIGQYSTAVEILRPFAAGEPAQPEVLRTLGRALIWHHSEDPAGGEFARGLELLRRVCEGESPDAETFCLLGEAHLLRRDDESAREAYRAAVSLDAAEPESLARFLEHEVSRHGDYALVRLAEPMIRGAMQRSRRQIEGCVNLPAAWATLALLHLLVNEPLEALEALARLLSLCEPPGEGEDALPATCTAARQIRRLRKAVLRLEPLRGDLKDFDTLERALLLATALRGNHPKAREELAALASWTIAGKPRHLDPDCSVVIVAGGCESEVEAAVEKLRRRFLNAFTGLPLPGRSLVLVCGGTTAGISGLAGEAAAASGGRIGACGYLPSTMPGIYADKLDSARYRWLCESPGNDFTALEPLQAWTDVVAAGIPLERVKLLAFAPGDIARVEIAFALSLGIRVGLIEASSLPPDRQFDESTWLEFLPEGTFSRLPMDAMTLRAFLLTDELPDMNDSYEDAARQVHENYRQSAKPAEPSLLPWESLPESLKISNYHQVAYWRNILAIEGLGVREIPEGMAAREPFDIEAAIGEDGLRRLAEMEHGRWNIERLLRGWNFAEKKDISKKLSPYLVPWNELTEEIKGYDIDAIHELPENLRKAGFEVFQKRPGTAADDR